MGYTSQKHNLWSLHIPPSSENQYEVGAGVTFQWCLYTEFIQRKQINGPLHPCSERITLTERAALKAKSSLSPFLSFPQTCMWSPPIFTQRAVLCVTTVRITGRGQKQSPLNDCPAGHCISYFSEGFHVIEPHQKTSMIHCSYCFSEICFTVIGHKQKILYAGYTVCMLS